MVRFAPHLRLVRERSPEYGDVADPPENADALEDLGDEIATLAAHIHAATHRLLVMIEEFDRRRGWERDGQRSCAHWLAFRTGIDLGAAREKVRTARALAALPNTGGSMARGELSFAQVRALTRVATAENEADLLELAQGCTAAQLERVVRGWKSASREDEQALERDRQASRTLSVFADVDGMYVVRGKLPPELGVLLMRAIEAASDAIFREQKIEELESERAAARRRADALGLLAERAMAAGFGDAPMSGTRAERYQVVLHVDDATLADEGEPGRSELEEGTRVSAETSRRLSCDAGVVEMTHAPDGSVLDVGRRTRTVPPALRRALEARDRGCRFPGCGLRFSDAHHVTHWADGGATSLANCLLLCRFHHTLVHEGGWQIAWWGEASPAFFSPGGHISYEGRWQPPALPDDVVGSLLAENRERGVEPDWRTAGARWKRLEDIPDRVLFPAMEALG